MNLNKWRKPIMSVLSILMVVSMLLANVGNVFAKGHDCPDGQHWNGQTQSCVENGKPEEPGNGNKPEDPGNKPEDPGQPGNPGQPGQPGQPGNPGNPGNPNPGQPPVVPGNNGRMFIVGLKTNNGANNPHVLCNFGIKFENFDPGQIINWSISGHSPTPGPEILSGNVTMDTDGEALVNIDLSGKLGSITPHPMQGYHLLVYAETGQPGGHKQKVVWSQCGDNPPENGTCEVWGDPVESVWSEWTLNEEENVEERFMTIRYYDAFDNTTLCHTEIIWETRPVGGDGDDDDRDDDTPPPAEGLDLLAVDRETGDSRRDVVVYTIDRNTMKPVGEITTTLGMTGTHTFPSLSPDGEQVVWTRDYVADDMPSYLWVANLDGTEAEPIQYHGASVLGYQPSWEPHGNRIAYVEPWSFGLRITDIENGYFWNLEVEGEYPTWSPDGQWLAFSDVNYNLSVVSTSGKGFGYTKTEQTCITPRWAPDGESIYCTVSWDYPETVELDFDQLTAETVAAATWLSPDHFNTDWSAQQIVPDEGGAHLKIRNLATDEVTYESESDERNPDWWSSNPLPEDPDMDTFDNWLESPGLFTEASLDAAVPMFGGYQAI